MEPETQPTIEVTMLGSFRLECGENVLLETTGRAKKIWILIEYLLAHRHTDIPQEKLIEVLWDDEECDAPFNALKNLVYRARKLLEALAPEAHYQYIRFVRNTYSWNNDLPCRLDIEEFEAALREGADQSRPAEERICAYLRAVDLYQGDFLPKSGFVNWVVAKSTYYTNLYCGGVYDVCVLLDQQERYGEIIDICEKAATLYPFEEKIHRLLLTAYLKNGNQKKALDHYDYVIDFFQKEMNVDLSESLRDLRKQMLSSAQTAETDLGLIKEGLTKTFQRRGAFFCDMETFTNIYRLQARSMERSGQSIYIGLITITDRYGGTLKEEQLTSAMAALKSCLVGSLRKGDVVARYSPSQFVVILGLITLENSEMVMRRIVDRFHRENRREKVLLHTRVKQVDPMD